MTAFKHSFIRTAAVLLALCIPLAALSGCGGSSAGNGYRSVSGTVPDAQTLATNDRYTLSWEQDGRAIVLRATDTGDYWSDILLDAFREGSAGANASSPISITVANTKTLKWDTLSSYSQTENNGSVVCKKLDNGVRVTYFFDAYQIAVPVDYVLREDGLTVTVDSSKILEDGEDYKLVSVTVTPFLCSVKNDAAGGQLFVPAGSGAVMHTAETPDGARQYTGEVYGRDAARRNPLNLTEEQAVRLPVFGAYGDGKGLMGIIEEGAASCAIQAQAGNSRLGSSYVGAVFYVRGYDEFSYVYHGNYKGITSRVNDRMSGEKMTVAYQALHGDEAGYAGIAARYRDYLLAQGMTATTEESAPYAVTLLGGTHITTSIFGIPRKKPVAMTTFSQAQSIVSELQETTGTLPLVRLMGYGDAGIRPGRIAGGKTYPAVYGSKTDFAALMALCGDSLFPDYDIVNFSKSGGGFSLNFDAAKTAIQYKAEHFPVTPLRVNDKTNAYYTLARKELANAAAFALKKAARYGAGAVSLSSLGSTAYSDEGYISKAGMEQDATALLKTAQQAGYKTAVAAANGYAAGAADVVFDAPADTGSYDGLDAAVPFYQMVFHGYKPLYTEAINLAENIPLAIARAAAYGMGLGYTLTDTFVDGSDDLSEYKLYGTLYADHRQSIVETLTASGYAALYAAVAQSPLVEYTLGADGVSCTRYANGTTVYVNQTDRTQRCPAGELQPYAFCLG